MSQNTITPWAERTLALVESEGHWAALAAWCEWAADNWYDQDNVSERETLDDVGHYALCCKIVNIADDEIESLRAKLAAAEARIRELSTAQWVWDDRHLETAIPLDEVGDYDDIGDVFPVRPIREFPERWVLVTEDGLQWFGTQLEAEDAWDEITGRAAGGEE